MEAGEEKRPKKERKSYVRNGNERRKEEERKTAGGRIDIT